MQNNESKQSRKKKDVAKTFNALSIFQEVIKGLRIRNLEVCLPLTRYESGKVQLQPPVLRWWYGGKSSDLRRTANHRPRKSHLEMWILAEMLDTWTRHPDAKDEQIHQKWVRNPDRVNLKHLDGNARITLKIPNPNGPEISDHGDYSIVELRQIKDAFEKAGLLYQMLRVLKSDKSRGFLYFMEQFYKLMMDDRNGQLFEDFTGKAMEEFILAVEHGKDPMKLFPEEPKKAKPVKVESEPPQLARGTGETPATAPEGTPPKAQPDGGPQTALQKRLFAQASGGNGASKVPQTPEAPRETVSLQPGQKLKSLADLAKLTRPQGE